MPCFISAKSMLFFVKCLFAKMELFFVFLTPMIHYGFKKKKKKRYVTLKTGIQSYKHQRNQRLNPMFNSLKLHSQKRFIKLTTDTEIKKFIFESKKNSSLQQRYQAKKDETSKTDIDINRLLKISSLPANKTNEELEQLKASLLKYIQFTNMLDDVELNRNNSVKCENIGNPFLKQDDVIDSMHDLNEKIEIFKDQEQRKHSDLKENTNLNRNSFYTYKK